MDDVRDACRHIGKMIGIIDGTSIRTNSPGLDAATEGEADNAAQLNQEMAFFTLPTGGACA